MGLKLDYAIPPTRGPNINTIEYQIFYVWTSDDSTDTGKYGLTIVRLRSG